jgi:hypothetical protein
MKGELRRALGAEDSELLVTAGNARDFGGFPAELSKVRPRRRESRRTARFSAKLFVGGCSNESPLEVRGFRRLFRARGRKAAHPRRNSIFSDGTAEAVDAAK